MSRGPAYAEWVKVATTDDATIFFDPDAIRRKGNLVKLWYLLDERILAMAMFSANMGSGNPVFHDSSEHEWTPVHPDSAGKHLWKLACNKK